MELIKLN